MFAVNEKRCDIGSTHGDWVSLFTSNRSVVSANSNLLYADPSWDFVDSNQTKYLFWTNWYLLCKYRRSLLHVSFPPIRRHVVFRHTVKLGTWEFKHHHSGRIYDWILNDKSRGITKYPRDSIVMEEWIKSNFVPVRVSMKLLGGLEKLAFWAAVEWSVQYNTHNIYYMYWTNLETWRVCMLLRNIVRVAYYQHYKNSIY